MIRTVEAFLNVFFRVKGKHIFPLFLGLCIPISPIQIFMTFFLAIRLLGRDIEGKTNFISFLSLPFKKRDLFVFYWILGVFLIFLSSLIDWVLSGRISFSQLIYFGIFFTFYYGVAVYFATREHSVFGMTILVFIIDTVLLSVPGYSYISTITQGNTLYSAIFSFLALGIGYYSFIYNYEG